MTLAAVLWDMDGLMVDSEPLWTVAESELAVSLGGTWTDEVKALVVGTRLDVAVPAILAYFGVEPSAAQVAETSAWLLQRMVELFDSALPLLPGVARLLQEIEAEGVPMALVSSSYRVLVDAALATGLGPFAVTLAGDEVVHGKPHPEPYLTAALHLGVDPARCVVLEDSPSGIASGEAAGCAVVAVPDVAGVLVQEAARRLVTSSLLDVSTADLRGLVSGPVPHLGVPVAVGDHVQDGGR
ncbi:MAG: HAD-superfamily hydrolase, subfamily variant 3 [Frankiales bacterium]|jgi:HAD superfamily hydrolase (TIGR01509 family)|nr:HAD-superfamily hydrolase, subfamily variant 3 [Frankiales bacterium]